MLTLSYMNFEGRKNAHLWQGQFFQDSLSSAGRQINPINMNFHLQTSFEIFDKNSADKIQSKKY